MTGYKTRKKRLRGTTSSVTAQRAAPPSAQGHGCAHPEPAALPPGEGFCENRERKVFDVWYTPTVKDVYAQLKVTEQMLSRCTDPALAIVKRKMYDLEDTMWQFLGG